MAFPYTRHQADWQNGEAGGTPITEAALDNIEAGIKSLSDILALVDAAGDLIVGSGADAFVRLAKGADDEVLSVAAGALDYRKIVNAMVDATAAIAVTKLAAGADGQYLKTAGSTPTWVDLGWNIVFGATSNEPPASSFATLDTRNSHAVLDFDDSADESAVFRGVLPGTYASGGVNVKLIWAATSATSGNVVWAGSFERLNAGGVDLDANSFGPFISATGAADSVNGETTETTIAFSNGANMDSLAAGEMFRLMISRDADNGSDTMTGDAELLAVVITEQ